MTFNQYSRGFLYSHAHLGKLVPLITRDGKSKKGGYKNMGMTPDIFFEQFVQGNYEDYRSNVDCIRRAFNAAVSASQLADHYLNYYKKNDPSKLESFSFDNISGFIEYLSINTKDCYRDIRSIATAYKHLYIADIWTIASPGVIESISFPGNKSKIKTIAEEWTKDSDTTEIKSKVVYTRKDGKQIDFLPTLETVVKFWEKLLYKENQ